VPILCSSFGSDFVDQTAEISPPYLEFGFKYVSIPIELEWAKWKWSSVVYCDKRSHSRAVRRSYGKQLVWRPANNFIGYESETPFFRLDKASNGMLEL
jgi:hypothetical protein